MIAVSISNDDKMRLIKEAINKIDPNVVIYEEKKILLMSLIMIVLLMKFIIIIRIEIMKSQKMNYKAR